MEEKRELLQYLKKNNIILSQKTLNLLANMDPINKEYFGLFTLSSKIIDFILVNRIFINDTSYNFIMDMSREYAEDTVLSYLKLVAYEPMALMACAGDNRIPKITENFNYIKWLKNKVNSKNLDLAHEALVNRCFRDQYYRHQMEEMTAEEASKGSIRDELVIWHKAQKKEQKDLMAKLKVVTANVNKESALVISGAIKTLMYYDDYSSANYLLNLPDIEENLKAMHIINQVRNVDEFNILVPLTMLIVKLRNVKIVISEDFFDGMEITKFSIVTSFKKLRQLALKFSNLNIYFLIEEIEQFYAQVIEEQNALIKSCVKLDD